MQVFQKASALSPVNQSPATDLLFPTTTIISFSSGRTCTQQASLLNCELGWLRFSRRLVSVDGILFSLSNQGSGTCTLHYAQWTPAL